MKITRTCGECGVPLGITRNLNWNANGTITQKDDPRHRLIFFESDNLDRLWTRLSELLGVTTDHVWEVVIDSKSRATRAFLHRTLPWGVNLLAHFMGYRSMIKTVESQGLVMGYGKITVGGQYPRRGRPERVTVYIEDPYSLPFFCGDFKGAAEVLEKRWAATTLQDLDSRRHQIDVTMRNQRLEDESFILKEEIAEKTGDMVFKSCSTCGTPLEMKQFTWDQEAGIIHDGRSGRRLAFFGTAGMLAVFEELAHELGERVSDAIIEVERENGLAALSVEEARSGYEGLRFLAAIRGLGLVTSLEMGEDRLLLRMSNPSIPEYIVGLALAIFELVIGRRGRHAWSIEPDGDLVVEVAG
jgi:ribosomal protein L37E